MSSRPATLRPSRLLPASEALDALRAEVRTELVNRFGRTVDTSIAPAPAPGSPEDSDPPLSKDPS